MIHYGLNNAQHFDCSNKQYPAKLSLLLSPIVRQVRAVGYAEISLPSPLDCYSIKATAEEGCAMFDISDQQGFILSFSAVVWDRSQHERCWNLIESIYLKLVREFDAVRSVRAPQIPIALPWLATLDLFPLGGNAPWLAELEECFALQLIETAKKLNQTTILG